MANQQNIQQTVRDFIQQNFIFDPTTAIKDDESLLGSGIIDSTGVLELIGYLEEKFQLTFENSELIGENFDSILKITRFLQNKLSSH